MGIILQLPETQEQDSTNKPIYWKYFSEDNNFTISRLAKTGDGKSYIYEALEHPTVHHDDGCFEAYDDGQIRFSGQVVDEVPVGLWKHFVDRNVSKTFDYDLGFEGEFYGRCYFSNGMVESEGPAHDERGDFGKWKYYDESGKLLSTKQFPELSNSGKGAKHE